MLLPLFVGVVFACYVLLNHLSVRERERERERERIGCFAAFLIGMLLLLSASALCLFLVVHLGLYAVCVVVAFSGHTHFLEKKQKTICAKDDVF